MEPAALVFDRADERGRRVSGAGSRRTRRVVHEHLEVVQFAEHVLRPFELGDFPRHAGRSGLARQLEDVAKPLGGDPHAVEALGRVERAGRLDGLCERLAPALCAVGQQASPGRTRRLRIRGQALDPTHEARGILTVDLLEHGPTPPIAVLADVRPCRTDRDGERRVSLLEVGEQAQRDIELAHGAERPCDSAGHPHRSRHVLPGRERRGQRQRFTQATRRDPGLVHRGDVTVERPPQVPSQRRETTLDQTSKDDRQGHVRMGADPNRSCGQSSTALAASPPSRSGETARMRIAAIDIGTNSVHMIVVQVRPDFSFEVIDREKEMVRLGAGGLDGRALGDSAMASALQALGKFRRLADSYGVDQIVAAATSATREAENGGDFLDAVRAHTGIEARVISGMEEARLIHLAAVYGAGLGGERGVVVDIGGGSVEITLGSPSDVALARSFKIGVIRLTERFVGSDPLSTRDERRLVRYVRQSVGPYLAQLRTLGFGRVVGTSGTILSLGALAAREERGAIPSDLRNFRVGAPAVHRLRRRLVATNQRQRVQFDGLDPRRADIVVAGVVLLDTVLRELGADSLVLCDLALREGLVIDYITRNKARIAQVDRYPDIRRRSVVELGERWRYWSAHTQQVARLALSLFDQTRDIHGLGDREREWLEYGALLHDIGMQIAYEGHHKHSYYLIRHGGLRGFEPEEIEVIGLVARYHRSGAPKKAHTEFADLRAPLRPVVRTLSAFTAVAESLDRTHSQLVGGVDVHDRGEDSLLRARAGGDIELEIWAAQRHLHALSRVLGRPVFIEAAGVGLPAAPRSPGPEPPPPPPHGHAKRVGPTRSGRRRS